MSRSTRFFKHTASAALLLIGLFCLRDGCRELLPQRVWAADGLQPGDLLCTGQFEGMFFAEVPFSGEEPFGQRLAEAKNRAIESYRAFERGHPEVFWLSSRLKIHYACDAQSRRYLLCLVLSDRSGFSACLPEFAQEGKIAEVQAAADALVQHIAGMAPKGSRWEKAAYLHDWITHNCGYNSSADLAGLGSLPHSALSALAGRYGERGPVCGGYAKAFQLLCLAAGIPARQEIGTCVCPASGETSYHTWNSVQLEDGRWYGVDVTWDDPAIPGAKAVSGQENRDWLLAAEDQIICGMRFCESHRADPTPGILWTEEERRKNDALIGRFAELVKEAARPF